MIGHTNNSGNGVDEVQYDCTVCDGRGHLTGGYEGPQLFSEDLW